MNENYKQLKSVGQGEDISALKNNIDKVFYNNNEDNVEYWTGLPWMKIWSDSNISMIKDVRVPVTNFTVPKSIEEYLWDIEKTVNPNNLTKALIINGDMHNVPYVRIKELDMKQGNVNYYAWVDSKNTFGDMVFTTVDYSKGKHTGNYYEGYMVMGPEIGTLHENMDIIVMNYIFSQQTVSFDKCSGRKIKLYSDNFSFDGMASGLTKVMLSEGIGQIKANTFRNCTKLKEIYISSGTSSSNAPWGASNATVITI